MSQKTAAHLRTARGLDYVTVPKLKGG